GRTILYSEHHQARVFVERVDFNTLPGHLGPGGRPTGAGTGPAMCVTPLGVFDFPEPDRSMAVRSLHPGIDKSEVDSRTGFALIGPAPPVATPAPTEQELTALRALDPEGLLRTT